MHNHYRTQWLYRVSGALGKAQFSLGKGFAECCTRQRPLGKKCVGKVSLPSVFCRALGKAFAERPTLGKVGTEKKPEKMRIFTKKQMEIFFNRWRPPPANVYPSPAFEPATSPCVRTSSTTTPHCHLCLDSVLVSNILY